MPPVLHRLLFTLPVLLWYCSSCLGQSPSASSLPAKIQPANGTITIEMSNCKLSDVVRYIGTTYKINIVADAFLNDEFKQKLVIREVPKEEALMRVAQQFSRDMLIVNDVVVWRHQFPQRKAQGEISVQKEFGWKWPDRGSASIFRILPTPQPTTEQMTQGANLLPAQLITLDVRDCPVNTFATTFTKEVSWRLSVNRSLAERRISMNLQNVTPAQTLGALTLLLSAAQVVSIGQTEEQIRRDADVLDNRHPLSKERDKITTALLDSLTQEQRSQISKGESVTLDIATMNPALRKKSVDFITFWLDGTRTAQEKAGQYTLLPETYGNFKIVVKPNLTIGITGFMSEGQPPYKPGMEVSF